MQKKKLPVGIEDFEEIRTEGFYYIPESVKLNASQSTKSLYF